MEQKVEMGPFERFKVGSGTLCVENNPFFAKYLGYLGMCYK